MNFSKEIKMNYKMFDKVKLDPTNLSSVIKVELMDRQYEIAEIIVITGNKKNKRAQLAWPDGKRMWFDLEQIAEKIK